MSSNDKFLQLVVFIFISVRFAVSSCIFDDIQTATVPVKILNYHDQNLDETEACNSGSSNIRIKRDVNLYRPIRIHVHYLRLEEELTLDEEQEKLKSLVSLALSKVTKILSVIPVKGKLLLGRNPLSCSVHDIGPNKDRCARINSAYLKETCVGDVTIPDEHMEGVFVWNTTHPIPVHTEIPDGQGLVDTDYVLYVQSLTTKTCASAGLNVLAYASYCHLDQKNRPISGYMNLCPASLKDTKSYNQDKSLLTVLHELFHALGFSKHLYKKFQKCTMKGENLSCNPHVKPIRTVFDVRRLVTPKLVNLTSEHYGCRAGVTINEFGPALATKDGRETSHWDAAFIQGSIMAPAIGEPHLTILDKFTLTLFEDTGWYKVNYDFVEPYHWGKDGGCQFGLEKSCKLNNSHFFCNGNTAGCHYLHSDKGNCSTNDFMHGCKMFQPGKKDDCRLPENSPDNETLEIHGEHYEVNSRCFMSSLRYQDLPKNVPYVGRCYKHRCKNTTIQVQIGSSDWVTCPTNSIIEISGFSGFVKCPPDGILCQPKVNPYFPMQTTRTTQTTYTSTTVPTIARPISLKLVFLEANYDKLDDSGLLIAFRDSVLEQIIKHSGVTLRRMRKIHLKKGSIIFTCHLLPSRSLSDGPPSGYVFHRILSLVNSGKFSVTLEGTVFVASAFRQSEIQSPRRSRMHPGIIAVIVLVALTVACVAAGVAYRILRTRRLKKSSTPLASSKNVTKLHSHKQATLKLDNIQALEEKEMAASNSKQYPVKGTV